MSDAAVELEGLAMRSGAGEKGQGKGGIDEDSFEDKTTAGDTHLGG